MEDDEPGMRQDPLPEQRRQATDIELVNPACALLVVFLLDRVSRIQIATVSNEIEPSHGNVGDIVVTKRGACPKARG